MFVCFGVLCVGESMAYDGLDCVGVRRFCKRSQAAVLDLDKKIYKNIRRFRMFSCCCCCVLLLTAFVTIVVLAMLSCHGCAF